MDQADDILAARYALGVADLHEIVAAESRLTADPAFAARVSLFESVFSSLDRGITPIEPPSGLWDRIAGTIDDVDRSPLTETVRTQDLSWQPYAPGIDRKLIHVDMAGGASVALYRLQPGASVPNHSHFLTEECLVLEGEIEIDGVTVRTGDVHIALPASRHGPLTSRAGAVVYLRGDLEMRA